MKENHETPIPERPRYLPAEPFPPYSFVPGQNPHPVSDPLGHSFAKPEPTPPGRAYLRGIDLFNHGYYWEAHESWESLWRVCQRTGPTAVFLKGLIHLAAAGVKVRQGIVAGVVSHARRAEGHFQRLSSSLGESSRTFFGLSLETLINHALMIAEHGEQWPAHQRLPVAIVFPFVLQPTSELQVVQVPDSQAHRKNHGG